MGELDAIGSYKSAEGYYGEIEKCGHDTFDFRSTGEPFWRPPSPNEQYSCLERVNGTFRGYKADERAQITIEIVKRTAIPAVMLLLLVGYMGTIGNIIKQGATKYVAWVRGHAKQEG